MISLTASASAMLCSFPPAQLVQLHDGCPIYGIDSIVAFLQCTSEVDNPALAALLQVAEENARCPCRRGSTGRARTPRSDCGVARSLRTVSIHDRAATGRRMQRGVPQPAMRVVGPFPTIPLWPLASRVVGRGAVSVYS